MIENPINSSWRQRMSEFGDNIFSNRNRVFTYGFGLPMLAELKRLSYREELRQQNLMPQPHSMSDRLLNNSGDFSVFLYTIPVIDGLMHGIGLSPWRRRVISSGITLSMITFFESATERSLDDVPAAVLAAGYYLGVCALADKVTKAKNTAQHS